MRQHLRLKSQSNGLLLNYQRLGKHFAVTKDGISTISNRISVRLTLVSPIAGENEQRQAQAFTYDKNDDGSYAISERTDYIYEGNKLRNTYTFDTADQGLSFSEAREKVEGKLRQYALR